MAQKYNAKGKKNPRRGQGRGCVLFSVLIVDPTQFPIPPNKAILEGFTLEEAREQLKLGEQELANARLLVIELEADQQALREYIAKLEAEQGA